MKTTQQKIAMRLKVGNGFFSDILNGKSEPGKGTAKKFAAFTGVPWVNFLVMTPGEIRATLFTAAKKQIEETT